MGCQIHAGDMEVAFTSGAQQVLDWCYRTNVRLDDDFEYDAPDLPPECAVLADKMVPMDFATAQAEGFISPEIWSRGYSCDQESFDQIREFLRYAAENKKSIYGSM